MRHQLWSDDDRRFIKQFSLCPTCGQPFPRKALEGHAVSCIDSQIDVQECVKQLMDSSNQNESNAPTVHLIAQPDESQLLPNEREGWQCLTTEENDDIIEKQIEHMMEFLLLSEYRMDNIKVVRALTNIRSYMQAMSSDDRRRSVYRRRV